jgi:hypothetical protein
MHSKIVGNIGYICESGSKGLIRHVLQRLPLKWHAMTQERREKEYRDGNQELDGGSERRGGTVGMKVSRCSF